MALIPFIIVQVVAFAAVVLVLRRVMLTASYAETRRLQQLNMENDRKARELEEKIEEAERQYKEKIANAEDEIRGLKEKAREEAGRIREEALARAKEERERLIGHALNAKERLREEAEGGLLDKGLAFARRIVTEILSAEGLRAVYDTFLETVLREMQEMDDAALQGDDFKISGVIVRTSHEMRADQRERLENILAVKLGGAAPAAVETDKNLIAGIVIEAGHFVIDASLAEKFKKAAERIRQQT